MRALFQLLAPSEQRPAWLRILIVVLSLAVVLGLRFYFDRWLGLKATFGFLLIAVTASAWLAGMSAGVATSLIGCVLAMAFFAEPSGQLQISEAQQGLLLGLFLAQALFVTLICGFVHYALAESRKAWRAALAAEQQSRRERERSERRFRSAWEADIFGICIISREGKVTAANDAFLRLHGGTRADLEQGRVNLWARIADHEVRFETYIWEQMQATGRCAPFEKTYLRGDGSQVPVMAGGSILPEGEECVVFMLDLSARQAAQAALERKRLLLKLIIDAMPALVAYVDKDHRYQRVNLAYRKWFGVDPQTLHQSHVRELLGERAFAEAEPMLKRVLAGEEVHYEQLMHYRHGPSRWVNATLVPHFDEQHRVLGYVTLAIDITERKRSEQALAESFSRYRFLTNAMPQFIWTARPEGGFDYINERWSEFTGLAAEALLEPDGWLLAIHPEDRELARLSWIQAVALQAPWEQSFRLQPAVGPARWHLVRALPRRNAEGKVEQWVGSATDIDAQRRAYADLATARELLSDHASNLEALVRQRTARLQESNDELEAFSYSVSHDLRAPVHYVRGFAEAVAEEPGNQLTEASRGYLQRILAAAERMDQLIKDLLAYSRLSRGGMQIANQPLAEVVAEVVAQHQMEIQRTGTRVLVAASFPVVRADRTGLVQTLDNLLGNALKFRAPDRPLVVRIQAEPHDGQVRLWVEDNGIGIDPRHHRRIFNLFERVHADREFPGTGIGLSLVRKAVSRMGGACGVESALGQGCRFWIDFLPGEDPPPASPAADDREALGAHSSWPRTNGHRPAGPLAPAASREVPEKEPGRLGFTSSWP